MNEEKRNVTENITEEDPDREKTAGDPGEPSPNAPSAAGEVTIPRVELEELKEKAEERDRFFQQLQRTVADYDNYQKRVKRDRPIWEAAEVRKFLLDFLPAMDDFRRILSAVEESISQEELTTVLKLLGEKLSKILSDWKVEAIATEGEAFDPNLHEALRQEPSDEVEPGRVLSEIRKGYTMNGNVLRAAQVVVACGSSQAEVPSCENGGEESAHSQEGGAEES